MGDCVYQAFKKAGYEYPKRLSSDGNEILQFCKEHNLKVHFGCTLSLDMKACIIVAWSTTGNHAEYFSSLREFNNLYPNAYVVCVVELLSD